MSKKTPLNPVEAEHLATELRAEHGLGQKYRIRVEPTVKGWHIRDQAGHVDSVPPMPADDWQKYLEDRFVEAITAHEETSEA